MDYTYFLNFENETFQIYKSIRPEKIAGDPQVKDLRVLKYETIKKVINFKLSFTSDYEQLPQRAKKLVKYGKLQGFQPLYKTKLPLTLSKFRDLQDLKEVIPVDTHQFYDGLPHAKVLVQKDRKI